MKIIITGARGFIGSHLARFFAGEKLILLSRDQLRGRPDRPLLADADLVIHLAGENIVGRWTPAKMQRIRETRLASTRWLVEALKEVPPKVYIGASAIGIYGVDRGEEVLTEQSQLGEGFLAELCQQWEALHGQLKGSRVILARFGMVVGQGGGVLQRLLPLFKLGLGGKLGSGKQWMSWIGIEDLCAICRFCYETAALSGPINFTAPKAMTNAEWTKALGKAVHRWTPFSVPVWALRLALGEGAEVMLGSLRVKPDVLLRAGYAFKQKEISFFF